MQAKRTKVIENKENYDLMVNDALNVLRVITNLFFKSACESLMMVQSNLIKSHLDVVQSKVKE
jgi:hypothetical protein